VGGRAGDDRGLPAVEDFSGVMPRNLPFELYRLSC